MLLLSLHAAAAAAGPCEEFKEGACELTEDNILGYSRDSPTPAKCQVGSIVA